MTTESHSTENKDSSKLVALLLLIGAIVLLILYLGSDGKKKKSLETSQAVKSEKYEKSVNKHLMVTNETIEMQRQRMEIENARFAKDLDAASAQPKYVAPQEGADLATDHRASDIADLLGRGERKPESFETPNDIIQKELFNRQQMDEYSKAYKEEYARQFVENARRGGYKVQLDDNFKVISVSPIRKPSHSTHENILNPDGGGLQ